MKRKLFHLLSLLSAAFLVVSCSDVNDKNQLSVYVCDTPADYEGVSFRITALEVREVGTEGGWVALPILNGNIALLDLVNGKMQQVSHQTMDPGKAFDAVRFTFGTDNAVVVVGGENKPLAVDPQDASVIVPIVPFTMDGPNTPLLFDIDAATSVVEDVTVEGGYRLRPQVSFVDTQERGVVEGGFQAGQQAMSVKVWMRFTDVATGAVYSTYSSLSPSVGAFFLRLPAGDYTLDAIPAAGAGLKSYTARVSIGRQQVTDLGVIVLEPLAAGE